MDKTISCSPTRVPGMSWPVRTWNPTSQVISWPFLCQLLSHCWSVISQHSLIIFLFPVTSVLTCSSSARRFEPQRPTKSHLESSPSQTFPAVHIFPSTSFFGRPRSPRVSPVSPVSVSGAVGPDQRHRRWRRGRPHAAWPRCLGGRPGAAGGQLRGAHGDPPCFGVELGSWGPKNMGSWGKNGDDNKVMNFNYEEIGTSPWKIGDLSNKNHGIWPSNNGDLTKQHGDFDADSTTLIGFEIILKRGDQLGFNLI